jgi:uncharacterized protein
MTDDKQNSNDDEKPESLIHFPCDFPIKIFGKAGFEFESTVVTIIRKHAPNLSEGAIQLKSSGKGNYVSMTALVYVKSQMQLDDLYRDLVACELVMMVL